MRSKNLLALALTLPSLAISSIACASNHDLKTLDQKASYSVGVNFYNRMAAQGIKLELDSLTHGLTDAANGNKTVLTVEEMSAALTAFQAKVTAEALEKKNATSKLNVDAGKAFLANNAKQDGVITTKSGLQYKVIKAGTGATPKAEDSVSTHYEGRLIDGRVFDSSYKRNQPASFPVKGVIKGWTEALQLMKVGAKWQLFIPSEIAYGAAQRGELIQPNSTLVFDIELLEVNPAK